MSRFLHILFLLPLTCVAERFSIVHYGDIHSSFGNTYNAYATNTVPWILSHTNDGTFNIAGVVWTGDCYEDQTSLTNYYDPAALATNGPLGSAGSAYAGIQLTNDAHILAQSGLMHFVTDGNHDANNTNNTYGGIVYTRGTPAVPWNDAFPPSLWTNQSFFYTNKDAGAYNNMGLKFQRGNIKLLFLSYHTDPSTNSFNDGVYSDQTAWIRSVMQANPDYNVVVCGHYFLGQSDTLFADIVPSYKDHNGAYSNYSIGPGRAPVDGGILAEPNLLSLMSGHNIPVMKGIYPTNGTDGHEVNFVQFNTQNSNSRQNCDWINVLTFDTVESTVTCGTYVISEQRWIPDYETTGTFTNNRFAGGFRHTFTSQLPVRPRRYPIYQR